MATIKSDRHWPSEDTKLIKEYSTKLSSKLDYHVKKLSSFATSFDEILENISSNNIVGRNFEAATSELEATIEMKLDKITYDPTKTNDSFDMNISDIPSNKPSSYYEQTSAYLIKLPLLKSPGKYSRAS